MIISSLLDTDYYKFTMGQIAYHRFPDSLQVRYEFKCRNDISWTVDNLKNIQSEIEHFCALTFTESELDYLYSTGDFKKDYIKFLKSYKPNIKYVKVKLINDELHISIIGPWHLTIYFEVPILAIVSEVYSQSRLNESDYHNTYVKLLQKMKYVSQHNIPFVDFGTRRRVTKLFHSAVVTQASSICESFLGTSNVLFSMKCNKKPIGTMAHEFLQIGQALSINLRNFQKEMLQVWMDEYRGKLGIALTDIIGVDAFLKDFDLYFAKLYDGLRHDSGDPYLWACKVINHYRKLGINPKTKMLVFSDSLTFEIAKQLYDQFSSKVNINFGIGTHLTNDVPGFIAPQNVIKIVECNGKPVAKISDSPGKGMCEDTNFVNQLIKTFKGENDDQEY